jgi:hypothetical protein
MDNRAFKAELAESDDSQTQVSVVSSPGKRKFDERGSDGSAEVTPSRWDGDASPRGNESALEGEMSHRGDYLNSQDHEIIVGVDPKDLDSNGQSSGQEMQERGSMRMMAGMSQEMSSTIDNMDLDEVMEDENAAGESAAVKHVGFSE